MKITIQQILTRIEHADGTEIDEIINALSRRYKSLYPDWEVIFLSLPKNDPTERKRTLEWILKHEQ